MKKKISLIFVLVIATIGYSQPPYLEWVKQFESVDHLQALSMTTDNVGNVYVSGFLQDDTDFDPGPGVFTISQPQGASAFVCKLDSLGALVWAKKFGTNYQAFGWDIVVDESQNVYFTGSYEGTADFDPGAGVYNLYSNGGMDIFICKLSSMGDLLWAKSIGGSGYDLSTSIDLDSMGNVYTTGNYQGNVDFDPGPGVNILSGNSGYFAKLNNSGNFLWAKKVGTNPHQIKVGDSDYIHICGAYLGTQDFNPGPGVYNMTSGVLQEVFVSKYDLNGDFILAFGLDGIGVGYSMVVSSEGNMYVAGSYADTLDLDPSATEYNLVPPNSWVTNAFVSKYDSNGNFIWGKDLRSSAQNEPWSIVLGPSDNVYFTGYFFGTADFDPSPTVYNLTSANSGSDKSAYIGKLDSAGNFIWAIHEDVHSQIMRIEVDENNVVYGAGIFKGSGDFDPGLGNFNLSTNGTEDAFILKLTQCNGNDPIVNVNEAACLGFTSPSGNFWNQSGVYLDTVYNYSGCDSIISFNLTILTVDTSTTIIGYTITSNLFGATYQWLDCNNGYAIIPGQTGQSFLPITSGSYSVEVTYNGCADTSSCQSIGFIGIEELKNNQKKLLMITDLMGRETLPMKNTPLLYFYSDGTIERKFEIK